MIEKISYDDLEIELKIDKKQEEAQGTPKSKNIIPDFNESDYNKALLAGEDGAYWGEIKGEIDGKEIVVEEITILKNEENKYVFDNTLDVFKISQELENNFIIFKINFNNNVYYSPASKVNGIMGYEAYAYFVPEFLNNVATFISFQIGIFHKEIKCESIGNNDYVITITPDGNGGYIANNCENVIDTLRNYRPVKMVIDIPPHGPRATYNVNIGSGLFINGYLFYEDGSYIKITVNTNNSSEQIGQTTIEKFETRNGICLTYEDYMGEFNYKYNDIIGYCNNGSNITLLYNKDIYKVYKFNDRFIHFINIDLDSQNCKFIIKEFIIEYYGTIIKHNYEAIINSIE